MKDYITELTSLYEEHRNAKNAGPMEKYMKDRFPFLGIKKPLRAELEKRFYVESQILKKPFDSGFVMMLWNLPEREYQYTALGYIGKYSKNLGSDSLVLLKNLIIEKSWWDTVDTLAAHPVGTLVSRFPEELLVEIDGWATSDNMWLRRTAILHQLRYKENTDEQRLYLYIKQNAASKEFFIQKAIGWALREYSKTNPNSVQEFILGAELAALSRREGSKYLG